MKKLIAITLALAMLVGVTAPALAAHHIFLLNINWVGTNDSAVVADSWSGNEDIDNTDGDVAVTNDNANADAAGVVATNNNVSDVGESSADSHHVAVINFNGAGSSNTGVGAYAYTGDDEIDNTDGDVNVYNGTTTTTARGFVVTNTNITRVR